MINPSITALISHPSRARTYERERLVNRRTLMKLNPSIHVDARDPRTTNSNASPRNEAHQEKCSPHPRRASSSTPGVGVARRRRKRPKRWRRRRFFDTTTLARSRSKPPRRRPRTTATAKRPNRRTPPNPKTRGRRRDGRNSRG